MKNILSVTDLLAAPIGEVELVDIPELGGSVYVRELNAFEFDQAREAAKSGDKIDTYDLVKNVVVMSICDEFGKQLLDLEQADELSKNSRKVMQRLAEAANKLNFATEQELGNSSATDVPK